MKFKFIFLLILTVIVIGFFANSKADKPLNKSVTIDKIVVEKGKRRLNLFFNDKLIKTYKISLGHNSEGDKEFEGDKKTPEGKYLIIDKNPNSGYYKNLGISYPNNDDVKQAEKLGKKPGGEIKIHGLKNGLGWIGKAHLLIDWTAGCIALTNNEIDELFEVVKIGTPIEIKP